MGKFLITIMLVSSLVFLQTGCGKMKDAVDATARISAQTLNLVRANRESYEQQLYSRETARQIALFLDKMIDANRLFNAAVRNLYGKYKTTGKEPSRIEMNALANLFWEVEKPFREMLVLFRALTPGQSALVEGVILGLQQLLNIIRTSFSFGQNYMTKREAQWT